MIRLVPALLTATLLLGGCDLASNGEDPSGDLEGVSERGSPDGAASPPWAAPPGEDPGTVRDHSDLGYEALVTELETDVHPDALYFQGVLPCASCPGIRTKLTLVPGVRLYVLRETYLEAVDGEDATFTTVGSWGEEPGVLEARPEAPVLRLEGAPDGPPRAYLARLSLDTLRLLDPEGEWIESDLPYELIRVDGS